MRADGVRESFRLARPTRRGSTTGVHEPWEAGDGPERRAAERTLRSTG